MLNVEGASYRFMSTFLIVNPAAGGGRAERALPRVLEAARRHWGDVEVLTTSGPGDATALARQAVGAERLIVVGGDGTIHETANGLLSLEGVLPPLGTVPIGTGNDFVSLTGIGRGDPVRAIDRLAGGVIRRFDVGRAWGEYFVNSLGLGFDALVASHVPRYRWLRVGPLVYLAAVFRAYRGFRPPVLSVEADGEVRTGPLFCIEVGIGVSAGGGFYLTPDARPDDGVFDVCAVGPFGLWGFLTKMPRAFWGGHTTLKEVRMLRTARLRVRSTEGPLLAHLDGELRRNGSDSIDITIEPGRLPVITVRG